MISETIQSYPVMESFYTIQGEGHFTGNAAYFIRIGGCDVGCVWCDVKESWPLDSHASKGSKELVEEVSTSKAKICVITGGEPLMYDLDDLTKRLKEKGFRTHIETSGAYSMSGDWDWVCLSPKKFKAPQNEVCDQADELKIIVFNRSDFKWAESYKKKVKSSCQLFLQPEYSKESEMLPLIIDYVKENPEWRISLQTHKIINVP